jgi:hypothetical protein
MANQATQLEWLERQTKKREAIQEWENELGLEK